MLHVLIALEDPARREALGRVMRGSKWRVVSVASRAEARRRFPGREFDVVFADSPGPGAVEYDRLLHTCSLAVVVEPEASARDGDGLRVPPGFDARLRVPFTAGTVGEILSELDPTQTTPEASGADRPPVPGARSPSAEPEASVVHVREATPAVAEASEPIEAIPWPELIGESPALDRFRTLLGKMAAASAPVLITGETGTGKELAARQLHESGPRAGQPFVAVNCGAMSPTLMESQLFGHEKGSFSGADRCHRGIFERAHRGTLFLDEITEMPIELQVKLLRVLERGEFHRVGGEQDVEVDVRIVAATNRAPEAAVAEDRLRSDLYYRLRVLHLPLPPLRERGSDIELLARRFLVQIAAKEGRPAVLAPETLASMRSFHWPGNVRQLRNAVHSAYLMSSDGRILPHDLPCEVLRGTAPAPTREEPLSRLPLGTTIAEMERRLILLTLERLAGNKKQAASMLGISLKTLYNRMNLYQARQTGPVEAHAGA